jgi:hypothetical protein
MLFNLENLRRVSKMVFYFLNIYFHPSLVRDGLFNIKIIFIIFSKNRKSHLKLTKGPYFSSLYIIII